MKTMVIGSLMATLVAFQAVGQRAENDDMYFNSKDRKKVNESALPVGKISSNDKIDDDYKAFKKKHFDGDEEVATKEEASNPTDSYSARNVNPEYIARSNSEQASDEEQNYFDENYTPNATDSYSAGNNYDSRNNNWNANSSWYGSRWNSYTPYYGCRDPWMSPYYGGGSGLTISLTYGNAWNPWNNYGTSYGYGNPYYSSYDPYGYSPYSYYGGGYGNGYPNYYYGSSDYSRANYGKRPSRHSSIVTPTHLRQQSTTNSTNSVNGRSRRTSDEYYVKPAKRTWENMTSESPTTPTKRSNSSGTFDNSKTRTREWNNSGTTRPTYTPSRSGSSGSTPSRSSGSSSGTRRRN